MTSEDREARIKMRAYEIWRKNGCPKGTQEADWLQATQEIDAANGADASPAHPVTRGASPSGEDVEPDASDAGRKEASKEVERPPSPFTR
jgi:hypothetical protein